MSRQAIFALNKLRFDVINGETGYIKYTSGIHYGFNLAEFICTVANEESTFESVVHQFLSRFTCLS
jgi:hypothetical protein